MTVSCGVWKVVWVPIMAGMTLESIVSVLMMGMARSELWAADFQKSLEKTRSCRELVAMAISSRLHAQSLRGSAPAGVRD